MYNKNLYNESTFNDPGASTRVMQARTSFVVDVEGRAETASVTIDTGLENGRATLLRTNAGTFWAKKVGIDLVANVTGKVRLGIAEHHAGVTLDDQVSLDAESGISRAENAIGSYTTNVLDKIAKTTPVAAEIGLNWIREHFASFGLGVRREERASAQIIADILEKVRQVKLVGNTGLATSRGALGLYESGISHTQEIPVDFTLNITDKAVCGFTKLNVGLITKRLAAGEYHVGYGLSKSVPADYVVTATEKTVAVQLRAETGLVKQNDTEAHGDVGVTETLIALTYFRWGIVVGAYYTGIKRSASAPSTYWADLVDMTQYITGMFNLSSFNAVMFNDAGKPRRVMRAGCGFSVGCKATKDIEAKVDAGIFDGAKASLDAEVGLSYVKHDLAEAVVDVLERKQQRSMLFEAGIDTTKKVETSYHAGLERTRESLADYCLDVMGKVGAGRLQADAGLIKDDETTSKYEVGLSHVSTADTDFITDVLTKTGYTPFEGNAGLVKDKDTSSTHEIGLKHALDASTDYTANATDRSAYRQLTAYAGVKYENEISSLFEVGVEQSKQAEVSGYLDVLGRVQNVVLEAYAGTRESELTHAPTIIGATRVRYGSSEYFVDLEVITRTLQAPIEGYAGIADIKNYAKTFYEPGLCHEETAVGNYTLDVVDKVATRPFVGEAGIEDDIKVPAIYEAGLEHANIGLTHFTLDVLGRTQREPLKAELGIEKELITTTLYEVGHRLTKQAEGAYIANVTDKTESRALLGHVGILADDCTSSIYEAGLSFAEQAASDYWLEVLGKTLAAQLDSEIGLERKKETVGSYEIGLALSAEAPVEFILDVPGKVKQGQFVACAGVLCETGAGVFYETGLTWTRNAPIEYIFEGGHIVRSAMRLEVGLADRVRQSMTRQNVGIENKEKSSTCYIADALDVAKTSFVRFDAGLIKDDEAESAYEVGLAYAKGATANYILDVLDRAANASIRADIGLADLMGDTWSAYDVGLIYSKSAEVSYWLGVLGKTARGHLLAELGLKKARHGHIAYYLGYTREERTATLYYVNVLDKTLRKPLVAEVGYQTSKLTTGNYEVGLQTKALAPAVYYLAVLEKTVARPILGDVGITVDDSTVTFYETGLRHINDATASYYFDYLGKIKTGDVFAEVGLAHRLTSVIIIEINAYPFGADVSDRSIYNVRILDKERVLQAVLPGVAWRYNRRINEATEVEVRIPRTVVDEHIPTDHSLYGFFNTSGKLKHAELASYIQIYKDNTLKVTGKITTRDLGQVVTIQGYTEDIQLEGSLTPAQYGKVWDGWDLADVARDVLDGWQSIRVKDKSQWRPYMVGSQNVDLETDPGLVMLAKRSDGRYYESGHITLMFSAGEIPDFKQWDRIRWSADSDGASGVVQTTIQYSTDGITWSTPWDGGLPEEVGLVPSGVTEENLWVRINLHTTDTESEDSEGKPVGVTPTVFACEVIARTKGELKAGSIPTKAGVAVKGLSADYSDTFQVLLDACEQVGWEFNVWNGKLNIAESLGVDRSKEVLLRGSTNTEVTSLGDDDNELANIITAYGPGQGINRLQTTVRDEESVAHYGPYPLAVEFDVETIEELNKRAREFLEEHNVPKTHFEVFVAHDKDLDVDYSLGDTVKVADPDTGIVTTARIMAEAREYTDNGLNIHLELGKAGLNLQDILEGESTRKPDDPLASTGVWARGIVRGVRVGFSKPRGDWDLTEVHVSTEPNFVPSSSTLVDTGKQTQFDILGLEPRTRYYIQTVNVDSGGNRSKPSREVSAVPITQREEDMKDYEDEGIIDEYVKGMSPVILVTELPELPDPRYPVDTVVFLITEERLYRNLDDVNWEPLVKMNFDELEGKLKGAQVELEAITEDLIAAEAITETKIKDGSIETPKLAAGAVTAAKLSAGAVTAQKIDAGAVTTEKLAARAITAGEIAAGAIDTEHLATDAVTAGKIAAGAVSADKIAANTLHVFDNHPGTAGGGSVRIDSTGIHIKDGQLTLENPEGTVIIDGTSNVFKILKTGRVYVRSNEVFRVDTGLRLSYNPGCIFFIDGKRFREMAGFPWGQKQIPVDSYFPFITSDYRFFKNTYEGVMGGTERLGTKVYFAGWAGRETPNLWLRYYILMEAGV